MLNLKAIPHTHTHPQRNTEGWKKREGERNTTKRKKNPHITNKSSPIFELKKEDNNIFKDKGYLCDCEVCVCVVCVCPLFSAFLLLLLSFFQFQIQFALPLVCDVCIWFFSRFLLPFSQFTISVFVCFESVSGCLSLNIFCYYKCLHIARVHRSRRYYHFFHSSPSAHSNSLALSPSPFQSLPPFRYVFCLAMLQLCFATMWCIFSIHIICMNLKAPFMFHW